MIYSLYVYGIDGGPMLLSGWFVFAALAAISIVLDMRRLAVHLAGSRLLAWVFCCVVLGPLVCPVYLVVRSRTKRRYVCATWRAVGGDDTPVEDRRQRLVALHEIGMVGEPIFRHCSRVLDSIQ